MGSRSFKPVSFLAQMASGRGLSPGHSHSPRPSFTRTSSSSSTVSEDSIFGLKSLSINEDSKDENKSKQQGKENNTDNISSGMGAISPIGSSSAAHHPSPLVDNNTPTAVNTPGRKRSQPIAIELPARDPRQVYTPLSARGDLPGGYFPNHEDLQRSYKSHPFDSHQKQVTSSENDTPISDMAGSALCSPMSDATPRGPMTVTSSTFQPESLIMPMGKYHPSNYKSPATSSTTPPIATIGSQFSSHTLTIPKSTGKRSTTMAGSPGHERKNSDVKRKIQQYQRDMIVQARLAASSSSSGLNTVVHKPISPRLLPLGSPGPITPFELEESAGYLVAGTRNSPSIYASGVERVREQEAEMVDSMIRREEARCKSPVVAPLSIV